MLASSLALASSLIAWQPNLAVSLADITVRLDGTGSSGSGVLGDRQGQTYYILTNAHVVARPGPYQATLANGDRLTIPEQQIKRLQGIDLAILQFTSPATYPVASIGVTPAKLAIALRWEAGRARGGVWASGFLPVVKAW
ncbi:MAG: serine protease [Chloroflexaceae bacterium]|nr:serine protease [Chloroflexaceae bacterium]